eukprot:tig00000383_g24643.t1
MSAGAEELEELEVVEASKLERLEARGAGIVGIIGHVSFLASTSYVGGDSTSEAQSAMGDSLNWALMRPTNAPWVQNTSSRTAAQRYADEFSTVIFWTSIAFFGIWILRWIATALCRTALKKWSDGRLPPLFRFPFLELCFIMMCSPGLVLHAARVAAVGNAGPSWGPPIAVIMIVIIPGFFLIGCSFMLVTSLMGQTIVFTKEDRIAEKLETKSVDPSDVRVTRWQRFWNALKHPRRGFWEQTEYDQNDFMNRYSALFDAFAYARLGFMAAMLDSLKKVVSSLILGVHAGRGASSNAGTALGALLGVNLAYLSYLALSRPFIDRVENVVQMTSNGLQSVLLILMLMRNANYKKDEVSTGVMVVNMLSMAVLVVNQLRALRAIYNLTCPKKAAEKRARFKELQLDAGSDRKDKAVRGPRPAVAVAVAGARPRQQPAAAAGASARRVSIAVPPGAGDANHGHDDPAAIAKKQDAGSLYSHEQRASAAALKLAASVVVSPLPVGIAHVHPELRDPSIASASVQLQPGRDRDSLVNGGEAGGGGALRLLRRRLRPLRHALQHVLPPPHTRGVRRAGRGEAS